MKKAIKPDMQAVERMIVDPDKKHLEPVPYIIVCPEGIKRNELLNAIPYYLLAYGNNIELLVPLMKQPILKIIVAGLAKALKAAGKHYKIKQKTFI